MELYLQMGHGMQKMCSELLRFWGDGTVILSPVNIAQDKLIPLATKYRKANGNVLFDPQLYYPRDGADKLTAYDYWPSSFSTISDKNTMIDTCQSILKINEQTQTEAIIIPGEEILDLQHIQSKTSWIKEASKYFRDHSTKRLYGTLCLFTEIIRSQNAIEGLLAYLEQIDVDGYYIVARSSNEDYIITDPIWMLGMIKLCTCLKLMNKKVIWAFSNHQALFASICHIDAIASGNYMNTRQFVPRRFRSKTEDMEMRKSIWYFDPNALTEYKANLLDVAYQRGFLDRFRPMGDFANPYADVLFSGAVPSSTSYNETSSFLHYLHCLRILCQSVSLDSFSNTRAQLNFFMDSAENEMAFLRTKGFQSQNRNFGAGIEALRIAMSTIEEDYGLRLELDWTSL